MMKTTARVALATATRVCTTHDVKVPKALTDGMTQLERLTGAGVAPKSDPAALAAALVDHALAGTNPLDDPAVTRLATAEVIAMTASSSAQAVRDMIEARAVDLLAQHAPTIIKAWQTKVAEADATLAAARELLPGLDVDTPNTVLGMRPDQMRAWGEAREALALVNDVTQAWPMLVSASSLAYVEDSTRPLAFVDLPAAELDALIARTGGRRSVTPTLALEAGHPLSLATPQEFTERATRVKKERAHLAAQAEAEREGRMVQGNTGPSIYRATPFSTQRITG